MKIVDLRGKLLVHKTKKYNTRKLSDIRSIAIHHSLTVSGTPEAFANYHVTANGWPGIAYTYVVQRDGTVYQCWDHAVVGYHVGNSNKHALGICMVGDFRTQQPTPEQYASTLELTSWLQEQLPNATVVKGHSEYPEYSWKACPVIDMNIFRKDLSEGMESPMTAEERKVMDDLRNQIRDQTARIDAQAKALAAATGRMEAPAWFVQEFGSCDLGSLINEPTMTYEGWRNIAISLRTQGFGKGRDRCMDIK